MQIYDIVMLVVLVGAMLFGFWKGMAWQIASLASIILSTLVALSFGEQLAPFFGEQAPWNRWCAMLVLYILTALGIWLLFRLVAGVIDRVKLKEFDRQMGALFGLAKGVLYCLIITFFVVGLSESWRQTVLQSRSGHYIGILLKNAKSVLPEEITEHVGKYMDELNKRLDSNTPPEDATTPEQLLDGMTGDLETGKAVTNDLNKKLDDATEKIKGTIDDLRSKAKEKIDAPQ